MPDAIPNPQAESIFNRWGLNFELLPDFRIADIQDSPGQQVRFRANIANDDIVEEYFEQFSNGSVFPPVVLAYPGTIIDGNTRLAMARKAGLETFPVYMVRVSSLDLAKALGAALNQIGGVRLTSDEAYQAAVDMMGENLKFTDAQIAQITGKAAWQVKNWRAEQDAAQHAQRTETAASFAAVPKTQHKTLAKVVQDAPFAAAVKLAGSRRLPNATVKRMVEDIVKAPSEQEALSVVEAVGVENPAGGPGGGAVVRNQKARHMRMVLPQVINLRPPEELYEADKAAEDEKLWREVRRVADGQLAYYERMTTEPSAWNTGGSGPSQ
jgi:ParB-like chromosome segregation protein Spo0J